MAHLRKAGSGDYAHVIFGGAPIVAATVNPGGITVGITPPTAGTLAVETYEVLTGFTITAGAYRVRIKNVGSLIEGGTDADITVNGDTVAPGETAVFEFVHDAANELFKTLPAIAVVNASGAGVWYQVES